MNWIDSNLGGYGWRGTSEKGNWRVPAQVRGIALFILVSCFYSQNLWSVNREVPTVPLLGFLDGLPSLIHQILWIGRITFALGLLVFPTSPILLVASVLSFYFSASLDLARFQIFDFFFSLHLIVILWGLLNGRIQDSGALQRLMIIAMYFFAGLQKINLDFFNDVVPWFLAGYGIESGKWLSVNTMGFSVAIFEMAIGVLLFFPSTIFIGSLMALVLHSIIFYYFFTNLPFWPLLIYNVVQFFMLVCLFFDRAKTGFRISLTKEAIPGLILLYVFVLPPLNFVGLWPSALSFQFFSHSMIRADLYFEGSNLHRPKVDIFYPKNSDPLFSSWGGWASPHIGYFFFSTRSYFENAFQKICAKENPDSKLKMVLIYPSRFLTPGWREREVYCRGSRGKEL